MVFGQFKISQATRTASLGGQIIDLTTAEFDLLWLLASHAGNVLSRDDLLQELRGIGFDGLDRSIDARISRLRKKLNDDRKTRPASRRSAARATCSASMTGTDTRATGKPPGKQPGLARSCSGNAAALAGAAATACRGCSSILPAGHGPFVAIAFTADFIISTAQRGITDDYARRFMRGTIADRR